MPRLFKRLSLLQKVALTLLLLFILTSTAISFLISGIIRQAYLKAQKQNTAQFIQKQAHQYLSAEDFASSDYKTIESKFLLFSENITFPDVVRIKIYNPSGTVIFSDQRELVGQKLLDTQNSELSDLLDGRVMAEISKPDKPENTFEKQFPELLETYVPITYDDFKVVGIVETYLQLTNLNSQIRQSQLYAIGVVSGVTLLAFVILFFTVRQSSATLIRQDQQLQKDIENEKEYSNLKEEFITLTSHQLRTPASVIKWSLESLDEPKLRKLLSKAQQKDLTTAENSLEELISIINNILNIAELKPDYFTYENQEYSVTELINSIVDKYQELITTKKIHYTFNHNSTPAQSTIKKTALSDVLTTLIKNALDYTSPKGEVIVDLKTTKDHLTVAISDSGIGIPEPERLKLFDRFFRATNSIEQKNYGSGLSLYLAQKIARGYGGQVTYTALSKGSSFTLEIPLKK